jgi:hypothetical protein
MPSNMTDEEWQEYLRKRPIIEENNRKLDGAALNGDLELVKNLTTSPEFKGLVEADCNHNYPLRGACLHGHVPVIDFLINFPDEEVRNRITSTQNIKAAIRCSAEYHQPASFLYFKEHFPKEYTEVLNDGRHDQIIDLLTMRGKLEMIQLLMSELPKDSQYDYPLFIEKSIQYDKRNCFDYFLPLIDKNELKKSKKQEDIIHTALFNERFGYLEELMQTGVINLKKNLTVQHFRILVEDKFNSLVHIVHKYDYKPNKKLMDLIMDCVNKTEEYNLRTCIINFVKVLDKHELKLKLEDTLQENPQSNKPFKRKI